MRESLQSRCELFIQNRDAVKKVFRFESSPVYPLCANIFCARGAAAEEARLRACQQLLKEKTSVFSNFRTGSVRAALISLLAAGERPEEKLQRVLDDYDLLKKHFWGSEYLAVAAFLMAESEDDARAAEHAARARALYDRMKKEHPLLTSGEDSVFCALLAFSEKGDEWLIADMEDCYNKLKTRFHSSNDVQAVSHVLALAEGAPIEKVARLIALYDGIIAAGGKYGKYRELSILAALSALPVEISAAVEDMMAADAFLSTQKGYSRWITDRKTRMMHAAMLVSDEYTPSLPSEAAALGSTVAMIAAQQAAMCAVMASASASSAAASSH